MRFKKIRGKRNKSAWKRLCADVLCVGETKEYKAIIRGCSENIREDMDDAFFETLKAE